MNLLDIFFKGFGAFLCLFGFVALIAVFIMLDEIQMLPTFIISLFSIVGLVFILGFIMHYIGKFK